MRNGGTGGRPSSGVWALSVQQASSLTSKSMSLWTWRQASEASGLINLSAPLALAHEVVHPLVCLYS